MISAVNSVPQSEISVAADKARLGSDYLPCVLLPECHQSVSELHAALGLLDKAGTRFTEALVGALEHTAYKCVGDVLGDRLKDVFASAASKASLAVLYEIETMLTDLEGMERQQIDSQSFGQVSFLS